MQNKKPIVLVADFANRPLTRQQTELTLDLLNSENNNDTDRILHLIQLIKDNGGDFLLQVMSKRAEVLGIQITDAALAYLMLVFGVSTPGKSSLVMHNLYMANKNLCDLAKQNKTLYLINLSRLVDVFPDGTVGDEHFSMLWDAQKSFGDGTSGSGGNLVDKFDGYYYGN